MVTVPLSSFLQLRRYATGCWRLVATTLTVAVSCPRSVGLVSSVLDTVSSAAVNFPAPPSPWLSGLRLLHLPSCTAHPSLIPFSLSSAARHLHVIPHTHHKYYTLQDGTSSIFLIFALNLFMSKITVLLPLSAGNTVSFGLFFNSLMASFSLLVILTQSHRRKSED